MDLDRYKRIILVHKGALGDFLQTWPTILSIVRGVNNKKEIFWAGRQDYFFWLRPLGLKPLPWKLKQCLDKVYTNSCVLKEFEQDVIFWFILKKSPLQDPPENIIFLKGINPGRRVWRTFLNCIQDIGIIVVEDWRDEWNKFFVGDRYNPSRILIFPGSGHRLKNWPLDKFLRLGNKLISMGEKVSFVLGPVEREGGLVIEDGFDVIFPRDLRELHEILLLGKLVIGNDSGPMHLAGFNNVPTVSIFGPTDPRIWGPLNARVIRSRYPCAPCTSLIDIKCNEPLCIKEIPYVEVQEIVLDELNKLKRI